ARPAAARSPGRPEDNGGVSKRTDGRVTRREFLRDAAIATAAAAGAVVVRQPLGRAAEEPGGRSVAIFGAGWRACRPLTSWPSGGSGSRSTSATTSAARRGHSVSQGRRPPEGA